MDYCEAQGKSWDSRKGKRTKGKEKGLMEISNNKEKFNQDSFVALWKHPLGVI